MVLATGVLVKHFEVVVALAKKDWCTLRCLVKGVWVESRRVVAVQLNSLNKWRDVTRIGSCRDIHDWWVVRVDCECIVAWKLGEKIAFVELSEGNSISRVGIDLTASLWVDKGTRTRLLADGGGSIIDSQRTTLILRVENSSWSHVKIIRSIGRDYLTVLLVVYWQLWNRYRQFLKRWLSYRAGFSCYEASISR